MGGRGEDGTQKWEGLFTVRSPYWVFVQHEKEVVSATSVCKCHP